MPTVIFRADSDLKIVRKSTFDFYEKAGFMSKTKKRFLISLCIVLGVLLAVLTAFFIYTGIYYHADTAAIDAFASMDKVDISEDDEGNLVFKPKDKDALAGFIFYPGGKVEHTAYQPLMAALAERGILSVLVEMPFNLAVFDIDAADGIKERFPEISDWYIGGHSLGGSMAASYLEERANEFSGLVLLASYSTADLSQTELSVLSVYGSEDGVLNMESYLENKANLPKGFTELIIEGGCHAYFGMYGEQDGDGKARISCEEQIFITADAIFRFVSER